VLNGGHETWVRALAFSKDGAYAISGGCDGKITWWQAAAENPTPIRSIEAHKGWIRSLDVSPDGTMLASGGNDNQVRLWNIADGTLVRELTGHARHVYSVAFHLQGQAEI
jgi:WD40 repeat protein